MAFSLPATALLVSVLSPAEAEAACQGGADIIDIKNPAEGPLGAPRPDVIAAIGRTIGGRRPISVALGEFPGRPGAAALAAVGAALFRPEFLKIAFIAGTTADEVSAVLQGIGAGLACAGLPPLPVVAVAYADTLPAAGWTLADFAALAQAGKAAGCLVDTQEKTGVSLSAIFSRREIAGFIDACRRRHLFCGLAGSLRFEDIPAMRALAPDIIGVRSAACGGDRLRGVVTAERVSRLKALIAGEAAGTFPGCGRWPSVPPAARDEAR